MQGANYKTLAICYHSADNNKENNAVKLRMGNWRLDIKKTFWAWLYRGFGTGSHGKWWNCYFLAHLKLKHYKWHNRELSCLINKRTGWFHVSSAFEVLNSMPATLNKYRIFLSWKKFPQVYLYKGISTAGHWPVCRGNLQILHCHCKKCVSNSVLLSPSSTSVGSVQTPVFSLEYELQGVFLPLLVSHSNTKQAHACLPWVLW